MFGMMAAASSRDMSISTICRRYAWTKLGVSGSRSMCTAPGEGTLSGFEKALERLILGGQHAACDVASRDGREGRDCLPATRLDQRASRREGAAVWQASQVRGGAGDRNRPLC